MTGPWVDTHAHLDEPAFAADAAEVIAAAVVAGVETIINVGYRSERWPTTLRLAEEHSAVRAMLGVHPQHADEWTSATAARLRALLASAPVVALGEIGFDFFRAGPAEQQQATAFQAQLALAAEVGLPVVIHQRAAESALITALQSLPPGQRALLHSYEGTSALAELAIDRGFFIGVGGLATRPANAALRATLGAVPLAQVVLETDSPYLAPAGSKDRRNTPAAIPLIAARVASLWGVDPPGLARATTANARRFFGLGDMTGQCSPAGQEEE